MVDLSICIPAYKNPFLLERCLTSILNQTFDNYEIIENRPAAIRHAMDIAGKNDIIILAGKGHETYQEINGIKHHLDEREVVAAYLEEMR